MAAPASDPQQDHIAPVAVITAAAAVTTAAAAAVTTTAAPTPLSEQLLLQMGIKRFTAHRVMELISAGTSLQDMIEWGGNEFMRNLDVKVSQIENTRDTLWRAFMCTKALQGAWCNILAVQYLFPGSFFHYSMVMRALGDAVGNLHFRKIIPLDFSWRTIGMKWAQPLQASFHADLAHAINLSGDLGAQWRRNSSSQVRAHGCWTWGGALGLLDRPVPSETEQLSDAERDLLAPLIRMVENAGQTIPEIQTDSSDAPPVATPWSEIAYRLNLRNHNSANCIQGTWMVSVVELLHVIICIDAAYCYTNFCHVFNAMAQRIEELQAAEGQPRAASRGRPEPPRQVDDFNLTFFRNVIRMNERFGVSALRFGAGCPMMTPHGVGGKLITAGACGCMRSCVATQMKEQMWATGEQQLQNARLIMTAFGLRHKCEGAAEAEAEDPTDGASAHIEESR
jgi:hypothetical protein